MTVTDNVFPQSGDADYAENFATWLGRDNVTDYVETGMGFTVDYSANEVDISQGKAFVVLDERTISANSETRLVLDYTITTSGRTGVALNADEANNLIYLNPNISTNDSPSFEVETSTGAAGDSWLLIGEIDTVNDTSETVNRNPSADFTALTARESFALPSYSDSANAPSSESSIVYLDGSGSNKSGVYIHDGSEYISAGFRELADLDGVTGVVSIEANGSGNRPSAGVEGRVFIDETNDRIQFDDGSSWVDIGTNPSNIDAGDLGFDPATQNELDNHISGADPHHTRPTAGNGLKDQTNTFNIEPADFVGQFLTDNADNIDVQLGFGLEDDGSGQIQVDEDASFDFSTELQVSGGLNTAGDIVDGNQVIWDTSSQEVPDSAMGTIQNGTLSNNSVTVAGNSVSLGGSTGVAYGDLSNTGTFPITNSDLSNSNVTIAAGDGLKNGGSVALGSSTTVDVEPADFAGSHLSDDGADNLAVDDDFVLNTGDDITGPLNFSTSASIQSAGTDAIQFDANQNVTIANGDLTVAGEITEQDSL